MAVRYRLRSPSRAFSQFFKHLNSIISRTVRPYDTGNISSESCAAYEFTNVDWVLGREILIEIASGKRCKNRVIPIFIG